MKYTATGAGLEPAKPPFVQFFKEGQHLNGNKASNQFRHPANESSVETPDRSLPKIKPSKIKKVDHPRRRMSPPGKIGKMRAACTLAPVAVPWRRYLLR